MNTKVYKMPFARVYPAYLNKMLRKGRTQSELDEIICWLTGYEQRGLQQQIQTGVDIETFFAEAPKMHPNMHMITGLICGYRVENIEDPLIQKIRYLDKLIDELAKGKSMDKVQRK